MIKKIAVIVCSVLLYGVMALVIASAFGLGWLRWESHQTRDEWFDERRGEIESVTVDDSVTADGQVSAFVTLRSDSGLSVSFRIIRYPADEPLPVLLVLGGHRTGSDAVELFGNVGRRAVVALDYPYNGPDKVKGLGPVVKTIPLARQAFLDTPPAVSLVVDWLLEEPWVDTAQLIIVGASLGVPFAATAAARDSRIKGALLVHGAADNRLWLEAQVARRISTKFLHHLVAVGLNMSTIGPTQQLWFRCRREKQLCLPGRRPLIIPRSYDQHRARRDLGNPFRCIQGWPVCQPVQDCSQRPVQEFQVDSARDLGFQP